MVLERGTEKTKIMCFGMNHTLQMVMNVHVSHDSIEVEIVDKFKYLGIILNLYLRFDKHVTYLQSKVFPKMKTLSRIKCYIGQKLAIYLYNTLINPLFTFNDYVYDALSVSDSSKLQVLQNNCIRTCLKAHRQMPRVELFENSGIKPLETQRKENTAGIVYLGLNQLSTPFVNSLFSRSENKTEIVLRSEIKGDVIVPPARLKVTQGNIRYVIIR